MGIHVFWIQGFSVIWNTVKNTPENLVGKQSVLHLEWCVRLVKIKYMSSTENMSPKHADKVLFLVLLGIGFKFIQGVFKKRPNFCYKDFIAHFTAF
jgi:hypothetical protein